MTNHISNAPDKLEAVTNALRSINQSIRLPENIFSGSWSVYRFFESDNMFHDDYVRAARRMLEDEGASTICIVNLDNPAANAEDGAVCFLDTRSSEAEYRKRMRAINVGYIERERFASASNVGSWCIYCENANDVGVVAIREARLASKLDPSLKLFRAWPLDVISDDASPEAGFPFTKLVSDWSRGLKQNFGSAQ